VIDRVVDVAMLGLTARGAGKAEPETVGARRVRVN
jgi:hypothetical protein